MASDQLKDAVAKIFAHELYTARRAGLLDAETALIVAEIKIREAFLRDALRFEQAARFGEAPAEQPEKK